MIEVKDLKFIYPKTKEETLKGISFCIKQGEIFGFLGPSGAGKSTTQKILIGLLKDYSGKVSIMDKEIKEWSRDYYEKIGVSFELPNLYQKLTALENLRLIQSFYSGKTEDPMMLLKMVGLEDKGNLRISQYSKGMKMRLNFVRSLLHKPELIFLDEPTSGLDPVNSKTIKEIILEKKREGKTIFLTTHNMAVADELCDRVAFIVDGEIKLIDSPKELKVQWGQRKVRVEYLEDRFTVQKDFDLDQIGFNESFIQLIKNKPIKTMHTQEATLEDIFIQTTGRGLS
ncbi:fluoroquinolone transport system ATP-binding protein [Anaerosolibacter carboniphilus]|uniref:Fluoroquinolone transport system ATP-binding protein n=1 Tax=Anaerosolibacter carboniphilus TaxID=1417629 RepID=A0A841KYI3_9FIRM|nr:ABC transporter ATP-binding protein [Anaerosolibacter carboniphilus]MBB6217378.1 fluoroquinolone transport system ATP-binding protein [Anaerosolibacter carboniphilus]